MEEEQEFETNATEFDNLVEFIRKKTLDIPNQLGDERKLLVDSVRKMIQDSASLVQSMELCVRDMGSSASPHILSNLEERQKRQSKLNAELNSAIRRMPDIEKQRDQLFGDMGSGPGDVEMGHISAHEELRGHYTTMDKGSRIIEDSIATAQRTEDMAASTMAELERHEETLLRSRDRIDRTGENLTKARRILRGMMRRMRTNKCLIIFIIILLLAGVGVMIYFVIPKGEKKPTPTPSPRP
eukprot:gnl/Trimastix_PCT/2984.p1 GENE.gnl/Trimastix_PCT/2984~~gnl/Trimastix_PCT/2984.p1  ORF type:complete len:241 (-),score=52.24 gnl/Trimastix_PCT/2984:50-772(-)